MYFYFTMIMLFTLFVCLFITMTECVDFKADDMIVVKLDPAQVVAVFRSVMSSDYLKTLAQELASRAAEQFLVKVKNQQPKTEYSPRLRKPLVLANLMEEQVPPSDGVESIKQDLIQAIERTPGSEKMPPPDINTSIIDMNQAMTLLKEPLPDGDNLDYLVSPNLSDDEETKKTKKAPQVKQLMKVNGKYFRRFLGYLL